MSMKQESHADCFGILKWDTLNTAFYFYPNMNKPWLIIKYFILAYLNNTHNSSRKLLTVLLRYFKYIKMELYKY